MIQPEGYIRSLLQRSPGEKVLAQGWVKTRRDGKNVHFIQLNDGSSPVDLQVVLDAGVVAPDVVARITTGACLSVEGELVASPGKGQSVELKAGSLTVAAGARMRGQAEFGWDESKSPKGLKATNGFSVESATGS